MSLSKNNEAVLSRLWSVNDTYSMVKTLLLKESERFDFESMEIWQIESLIELLQDIYVDKYSDE